MTLAWSSVIVGTTRRGVCERRVAGRAQKDWRATIADYLFAIGIWCFGFAVGLGVSEIFLRTKE